MTIPHRKLLSLLALTGISLTHAPTAAAQAPAAPPVSAANQSARYAAAHDTLMRLAANVRREAEGRLAFFKTSQGSFGSVHRRVLGYASNKGAKVDYAGVATPAGIGLVEKITVKHRFGVELERVAFYDAKGRKILTERREDHILTRLELLEYAEGFNRPNSRWLMVHGGYLMHSAQRTLALATKKTFYYFQTLPAAE
ncbi:hypothetical protein [Hymenobacter convexus]|uniref:hypothetical protein n=1 Tax=Hymenobacter sp. CA1UV-4 TaxID=3063782 RepID=UPI002713DB58|nr:hypothetical protein [Hymenobacter sp. CA1UV-4]MDO7850885.1 hypothetical protein [Hymenobacter sp. CA1UV-4]